MARLDSDLIAHFVQSAEISHLLFGQSRPRGESRVVGQRGWDGEDVEKVFSIFRSCLYSVSLTVMFAPAPPHQPQLPAPPLALVHLLIGFKEHFNRLSIQSSKRGTVAKFVFNLKPEFGHTRTCEPCKGLKSHMLQ